MSYVYSFSVERSGGHVHSGERVKKAQPRYRGRCECGRQTHQAYSTPGLALSAIRSVHNKNIPREECHVNR